MNNKMNAEKQSGFGSRDNFGSWNHIMRTASLCAGALLLSACASKSVDTDGAVAASDGAAAQVVDEKSEAAVAAANEAKRLAEQAEQAAKQAAAKAAAEQAKAEEELKAKLAKAEAEAEKAEQAKKAAEEQAAIALEKAKQAEAAAGESKAQTAEDLVASLAAKDKFSVIKEDVKAGSGAKKSSKKGLVQKALNVSKSDLPVTVELWTLKKSTLPGDNGLVISTPTWQAGEGNYLSQVWLTLREGRLDINSSSDIDASIRGSGVKLNGGDLIPFNRIEGNNVAVLEGDWMSELSGGGSLEILMGFFPDKAKKSPLFSSEAALDALSRLVPTYNNLTK